MIDENNENKLIEGEDFIIPQKATNVLPKTPFKKRGCVCGCRHCPMVMTRKRYKKGGSSNRISHKINSK
jgi:hypothetical protein